MKFKIYLYTLVILVFGTFNVLSSEKIVFINVACYPAERSFADGSNVHVSLFHPMWWYGFITKIALNHNKKCFLVCSSFEDNELKFNNFAIKDDFKNYVN